MTTYLRSLQNGLHEAFARDDRVFLLGEDLLDPYGGAFKVSAGLSSAYPGRVLTTPISEAGITGVATGMALRGLRPVVEIMFGDFLTLCTDQVVNHASKFSAMYNGQVQVPLVVRTPMGGGRGYGPTHSQCLEKLFLGIPGLQVVSPSHAHDPGAQLQYAIFEQSSPVLFIEHKLLYPQELLQDGKPLRLRHVQEPSGYSTALLSNYAEGNPDVTVIAYGGLSRVIAPLLESLKLEEIRVLAVFPSSLSPLPIDTLVEMSTSSGRIVIAEEGTTGFNWGSELAAQLYGRLWRQLRSPIQRVASACNIVPTATHLENEMLITSGKIEEAILEVLE
jgi:pyruvate/2-oxoglutarate/acetoin dehydrogenase E1 component